MNNYTIIIFDRFKDNEPVAEMEISANSSYIAECIGSGILRGMQESMPRTGKLQAYYDMTVMKVPSNNE